MSEAFTPEEIAGFNAAPKGFTPDEIAGFNSTKSTTSLGDAAKSMATGLGRGILEAPGVAGDLSNLSSLLVGKIMPYIGMAETGKDWVDQSRKGLSGDNGFDMGSASIAKLLNDAGIFDYQPKGDTAKSLYNVTHFAGSVPAMGGAGIASAGMKEGIGAAAKEAAKDLAVGIGSGLGAEGGRQLASAANVGDDSPKTRFLMEAIPAVIGGHLTGRALNLLPGIYETPPIVNDMDTAGVSPHFASDVNPGSGVVGKFFSNVLPDRFGAGTISKNNAAETQSQLKDYAHGILRDGQLTAQEQGTRLQSLAEDAVAALKAQTTSAYQDVDAQIAKLPASPLSGQAAIDASAAEKAAAADLAHAEAVAVPGDLQSNRIIQGLRDKWEQAATAKDATSAGSTVATTNTSRAIGDLVNRASDPDVKTLLQTPTFSRFAEVAKKPSLSWNDMSILRTEVGQSMQGADGSELGILKQIYKGINDDMRTTASQSPEALDAFNTASQIAKDNNDQVRELTKRVINAPSPEMVPNYFIQQAKSGSTRLDNLFGTLDQTTPNADSLKGDIGRSLLNMKAAGSDGNFDLDQLMKFFSSASPEAKQALTNNPAVREGMDRASRIYDATAGSRALANKPVGGAMDDLAGLGLAGLGAGTAGVAHALQGGSPGLSGLAAMGAAAGYPLAMREAAAVSQIPGLVSRFGAPIAGDMMGRTTTMGLPALATTSNIVFPDVFRPEPAAQTHSELTPGTDLASVPKVAVVSHVAAKLGPRVAAQVPTDDQGYKAALFSLFANPTYRQALTGEQ